MLFRSAGRIVEDTIALDGEKGVTGWPLLRQVMGGGRRLDPPETLEAARERCRAGLGLLPEALRSLEAAQDAPVRLSAGLQELAKKLRAGRE